MTNVSRLIRYVGAVSIMAAVGCSKKSEDTGSVSAPAVPNTPTSIAQPSPNQMPDASTVLATVNGHDITLGEFNKEMEVMVNRMQGRVPPERLGQMRMQMRDQLLDNMIIRQVLLDEVKAQNIEVSPADFEEAVANITESLPPGVSLNDMLAQAQTSEDEFKTTLTKELQIRKLLESNTDTNAVASDEEIEAFYKENESQFERQESVSASHILIGTSEADTPEEKAAKRKELEDIREKIAAGADFAEMAMEFSSCPSKAQGGSLGNFTRGRMVPEFETAAFTQEVGALGEIVETQFGYHLIKVDEKLEPGLTPLEEIKTRLGEHLTNQKKQKGIQEYVETLREKADVKLPGAAPAP